MMAEQVGDGAVDRSQELLVGDRQPVLAQALRDPRRRDMAAVGEQHQPAPRGADPLEHLDCARLGAAAPIRPAVQEGSVDVEHEPAHTVEPQIVRHGDGQ